MKFKERLETKRLILRKPRLSDADDIVEILNNINVSKHLAKIPLPYTKKDALDFIKKSQGKWKKREQTDLVYALELKSEKKFIGIIGLHDIDLYNKKARTGSYVNEKYWKRGYMTEAKITLFDYLFNEVGLRKLTSGAYVENVGSNKTTRGLGYRYVGFYKKNLISKADGKIHDENIYELMKEDWKKALPRIKKKISEKIKKFS